MPSNNNSVLHALSVDVEEWLNATILRETGRIYSPGETVLRNSEKLLALFEEYRAQATWFFLGEVAEAFPGLVRRVAEAGHEIGVHGFHHHRPDMLPPETFRESIIRAKEAVEQAGGAAVMGYRAVAFGINPGTRWVLDVLSEAGFKYDASVFPMRLPRYGYKEAPTEPHWVQTTGGGWIYEIPITVCRFPGFRLPFAGGGYFRLFPYWLTSLLMKWESRRRQVVFYFHPYEIEAENGLGSLPEVLNNNEINIIRRRFILENRGRATVLKKMRRLLGSYCFTSISQAFRVAGLAPKHR